MGGGSGGDNVRFSCTHGTHHFTQFFSWFACILHMHVKRLFSGHARILHCMFHCSSRHLHAYYKVRYAILLCTCTHTTKYVTLFFSVLARILQNTLRYSSRDLHSCYTLRDMFPLVTYSLVRGNVNVTEHVRHESCNRAGTNSSK